MDRGKTVRPGHLRRVLRRRRGHFREPEGQLYLIADLGPAAGREDAYVRLLAADYLGHESGQVVIGLDENRGEFTLHRTLDGEMDYPEFEKILTLFVKAVRYWREWLPQPPAQGTDAGPRFNAGEMKA